MLYIVSKTFYRANFKNTAMTASVRGHNFAAKFHRSELENFCYVYELHRFVFFCFAHKLQNANRLFFNFSSEAEHVLALFLFFGQIEPRCSYNVCSCKKRSALQVRVVQSVVLKICMLMQD